MQIEPSPSPDGSCNRWHYYRLDRLIATLERVSARKWKVIDCGGFESEHKTRREAHQNIVRLYH